MMALALCACAPPASPPPSNPPQSPDAANALTSLPSASEAAALLAQLLPFAGDRYFSSTPYYRDAFGEAWVDVDHNSCNTRDDLLAARLVDVQLRDNGCYVDSGILHDPYTGATVAFERGPDTSPLVQIDHVVSLWEAWSTGAEAWTADQRLAFANDPLNLIATTEQANDDKGALSIAEWQPSTSSGRCDVARRVVAVKTKYGLEIRDADRAELATLLAECPRA